VAVAVEAVADSAALEGDPLEEVVQVVAGNLKYNEIH
jgi:hypothetical protein